MNTCQYCKVILLAAKKDTNVLPSHWLVSIRQHGGSFIQFWICENCRKERFDFPKCQEKK